MTTRNRREFKEEQTEEKVLTVDEALSIDRASVLYEKLSEITKSHGVDLLLKVRLIHSDYRTAGFIDDVTSTDEVQSFIENPESFLKSHYGEGSYRIDIIDGISRKYISHLKIDISTPKEKTNRQPDFLGEVTKAYKEGVNLGKSSQPNNQFPFDLTELVKLVLIQQKDAREREEKILERIRNEENRLREKELQLLEKVYSNNMEVSKQFQPVVDFMGQSGKVLTSAMTMLERSANFMHTFTPEIPERPFWERLLVGLGEKLINSNPQLLDKLTSIIPQMNIPQAPTVPLKTNLNSPIENRTTKEEAPPKPEANQFNFDYVFSVILAKYIKRATRNEDPVFCADALMGDFDDLLQDKLITEVQLNQAYNLLISEHLEDYVKNFFPDIVKHKAWTIDFQNAIKEGLTEPQEENPEAPKQ